MVTFCMRCGISLPPLAQILIKDGKERPSPYYQCPNCAESAGIESTLPLLEDEMFDKGDVVIKEGKSHYFAT